MTESIIPSYGKIYNVGHRHVRSVFGHSLRIQEKVDGSQISFMVDGRGELHVRSKNAPIDVEDPDGMFAVAVSSLFDRLHLMTPGLIYRGEYLQRPRHNVIAYSRVPEGHIAIWDVYAPVAPGFYLTGHRLTEAAEYIGLETVPELWQGDDASLSVLDRLLATESFLGGSRVEGVVAKAYGQSNEFGEPLVAKYVSPQFKETMTGKKAKAKPVDNDAEARVIAKYACPGRWRKAVIHLQESGELEESNRDIPKLMRAVGQDLNEECEEDMRDMLWKLSRKRIMAGATKGIAAWYQSFLAGLTEEAG